MAKMECARFRKIVFRVPEASLRLLRIAVVRKYLARMVRTRSRSRRLFCASSRRENSVRVRGKDFGYGRLEKKGLRGYFFLALDKLVVEHHPAREDRGRFASTL